MGLKELKLLNSTEAFISGCLSIAVPLYLLQKNLDIVEIGMIFSLSPLMFAVIRLFLASIADQIGTRKMFLLDFICYSLSSACYLIPNVFTYALAKVLEGVGQSSIWAVNRTSLLSTVNGNRRIASSESSEIQGRRYFAYALGAFVSGVFVSIMGFEKFFILLSILSMCQIAYYNAIPEIQKRKLKMREIMESLDLRSKGKRIPKISLVMMLRSIGTIPLFNFIIPIYFYSLGFENALIGTVLASYNLTVGVFAIAMRNLKLRESVVFSLIYPVCMVLFFLTPFPYSIAFLILGAIGDGTGIKLWEKMIFSCLKDSKYVSTDIAILHFPEKTAYFVFLVLSGFFVSLIGFALFFPLSAFFFILFTFLSYRILDEF